VGVEPTIHPAKGRIAGFEDREDHRTPCASTLIIQTLCPRPLSEPLLVLVEIRDFEQVRNTQVCIPHRHRKSSLFAVAE